MTTNRTVTSGQEFRLKNDRPMRDVSGKVVVHRSAVIDPLLTEVESRKIDRFEIEIREFPKDAAVTVLRNRPDVVALRDALTAAIDATEGEQQQKWILAPQGDGPAMAS